MTRLALGAVLAAALLAGGCGGSDDNAATASTSDAVTTADTTLVLTSQLSAGARRTSNVPGSQMVLTGTLFRAGGGSAIGRSQGACTRTAPGRGEVYECVLSFVLRDGVIHGQAMSSADGPADGAVTGGTDRYHDARGTFRYKSTGTPRVNLTIKLRG